MIKGILDKYEENDCFIISIAKDSDIFLSIIFDDRIESSLPDTYMLLRDEKEVGLIKKSIYDNAEIL